MGLVALTRRGHRSALSEIGALLKFILANSSLKVVADTLGGLPWVAGTALLRLPV